MPLVLQWCALLLITFMLVIVSRRHETRMTLCLFRNVSLSIGPTLCSTS